MTTTDFDYLATRNEIIQAAFRICGGLALGQPLSSEQMEQGVDALQLIVKDWGNQHLFLWSYNESDFTTQINSAAYAPNDIDPLIIGLDKAWVNDSDDFDIPLEVVSYSRYLDIQDKDTATGRPTVIAYRPTPSPGVYLYPIPDAVYTIKMLCVFGLEDFDTADGSGNLPVRFQRALKYALADDLFDEYPGTLQEKTRISNKAASSFLLAKRSDTPSETTSEIEPLFPTTRCK